MSWWPMVPVTFGPPVKTARGTMQAMHSGMWPKRAAWVVLPDGSVATVRSNPYRVDVTSPNGATHIGAAVKYQPIKVTSAERDAMSKERGPMPDDMFPAEKPAFEGLEDVFASPADQVWVGRTRAWNDSIPTYDVLDRNGDVVAHARLKPHSRVVGFGRGSVFVARQTPDDDFWHLERYDLTGRR